MAIVRTIIKVPTTDTQYSIPGDYTASQVQTMYASNIPGISNMTATTETATYADGDERIITFQPRSGNKG